MKSPCPMISPRLTTMAGIAACLWYAGASSLAQNAAGTVAFDAQVKPTFAAKCVACHSQEKRQGGLSLATYEDILNGGRSGAAVKPGKSASSLLMQRVTGEVQPRMPLGESHSQTKRLPSFAGGLMRAHVQRRPPLRRNRSGRRHCRWIVLRCLQWCGRHGRAHSIGSPQHT